MGLIRLEDAKPQLKNSDLLLFKHNSFVGWIIAIAGIGPYSHAAKMGWWHDIPMCVEVREFKGGRAVTLESQVNKYSGLIDVFRPRPAGGQEYDPDGALKYMINLTGSRYGYWNLLRTSLRHAVVLRIFFRYDDNDGSPGELEPLRPAFCSEAVAASDRIGGGVDPVPRRADFLVPPAMLSQTTFYQYMFTLVADTEVA